MAERTRKKLGSKIWTDQEEKGRGENNEVWNMRLPFYGRSFLSPSLEATES